jgi:hypothetical protein
MFPSFKYNNIKYSLVKVKDIINIYTIPKCQKLSLYDIIKYLDNNMFLSFNPITPLYFVLFQNKKYIIDGLHRLNVYKNNSIFLDEKIPVVEIQAHDEQDIEKYFNLINENMNKVNIVLNNNEDIEMEDIEEKNNIIINTNKYFLNNYPNTFKYNGSRRPYLNYKMFLNNIELIYDKKKDTIKHSNDLIGIILDLNNKYSDKDSCLF